MTALYSQRSEYLCIVCKKCIPYIVCKKTNQSSSKKLKIVGFPGGPVVNNLPMQEVQHLVENTEEVHNSAFSDDFLSMTQKAQVRKEK